MVPALGWPMVPESGNDHFRTPAVVPANEDDPHRFPKPPIPFAEFEASVVYKHEDVETIGVGVLTIHSYTHA